MVTFGQLLEKGKTILAKAEVPDGDLDAWYLFAYVTHRDRAWYFLHCDETAPDEACDCFLTLVEKRRKRIPLQHLTGEQEFMGLSFAVDERVLIPRQDTELLVETVLPYIKDKKVLDLCTGSGCIAISLDKLGKPETVHGVDLSPEALAVAAKNAKNNASDVVLWQSDLFEAVTQQYHVIVSNPPYIPSGQVAGLMPEVGEHEPVMALDGGADGLDFYRKIITEAGDYLLAEGILAVEIGCEQGEAVTRLFERNHFQNVNCHKDLCGNDRLVTGVYSGQEIK
jgi:release factor glutamine methyltransferase